MYTLVILVLCIIATTINLGYWCFIFSKLAFYQPKLHTSTLSTDGLPVSVIICARNESKNLQKNLDRILNQNYHSFEVIVVNDHSTDDTANVLLEFRKKNPYLRIINFTNNKKSHVGKKFALAKGIEAAQHETLLLTDADCHPASLNWIQKMQQPIREHIEIGLGYGPYETTTGILNKFIHYETVYTAIQYLSFALFKTPYMGVGRNLIYKKKLFHQAKGFDKHKHIASGDDDLFIKDVARKNNVSIIIDEDTFMYSEPKHTWKAYYRQKVRHLSTATTYNGQHQLMLGLLSASHFGHYLGILLLILKFSIIFAGVIYMVRILILVFVTSRIFKQLNTPLSIRWIPILDALYVLFYIIFLPSLITGKNNQWT